MAKLRVVKLLLVPTVLNVAGSVLGLWLVRHYVPAKLLAASNDVVGGYLQTIGTIVAVLLAFAVFVVWGQFNDASLHVEREASELLDLARTTRGLPPEPR